MVPGNARLLTTAMLNLLDNACKYSTGPVVARLDYPTPATLRVSVADSGIGMAATELARIYEPLYRADTARSRPGYGVGLSMTRKIILVHHGEIRLISHPGHGTTATVELPGWNG